MSEAVISAHRESPREAASVIRVCWFRRRPEPSPSSPSRAAAPIQADGLLASARRSTGPRTTPLLRRARVPTPIAGMRLPGPAGRSARVQPGCSRAPAGRAECSPARPRRPVLRRASRHTNRSARRADAAPPSARCRHARLPRWHPMSSGSLNSLLVPTQVLAQQLHELLPYPPQLLSHGLDR